MNKIILTGNMVADPEMRMTDSGKPVANFRIAVQRKMKDQNGKYQSDFIRCVAFGYTAEFVGRYFTKGSKIGIDGSLRTDSFVNKAGVTQYTFDVLVSDAEFAGPKRDDAGQSTANTAAVHQEEEPTTDNDDLPF